MRVASGERLWRSLPASRLLWAAVGPSAARGYAACLATARGVGVMGGGVIRGQMRHLRPTRGPGGWGLWDVTSVLDLDGPWRVTRGRADGTCWKQTSGEDVILMSVAVAKPCSRELVPAHPEPQTKYGFPSTMETRK